jgi:hypothetical protein
LPVKNTGRHFFDLNRLNGTTRQPYSVISYF